MATKKKSASKSKATAKAAPKAKASAKVAPKAAKAGKATAAARPIVPLKAVDRPRTKSEIFTALSDSTGLSRKEVGTVFAALGEAIGLDVGKKGPGVFTVPGLMKVTRINKPATKARKGINPFSGV